MLKNDKIRQFEFYNEISVCLEQCSQKIIKIYESFDQNVEYKDDKSPLTRADLEHMNIFLICYHLFQIIPSFQRRAI